MKIAGFDSLPSIYYILYGKASTLPSDGGGGLTEVGWPGGGGIEGGGVD